MGFLIILDNPVRVWYSIVWRVRGALRADLLRREILNKGKAKAKPSIDFAILHIGLRDAFICTGLPIVEATKRLNAESPSGIPFPWAFDGEKENQFPCPDGQGKTHYHLYRKPRSI